MADGNPYHDKHSGEFTSKSGGKATGHNAGKGNRAVAMHTKKQHMDNTSDHRLLHRFGRAVGAVISGTKKIENYVTSGVKKTAGAINYGIKAAKSAKDKMSKTADKVTAPLSYSGKKRKK